MALKFFKPEPTTDVLLSLKNQEVHVMTSVISSAALKPSYTPSSATSVSLTGPQRVDGDGDHGQEPSVSTTSAQSKALSSSATLGTIVNTHA